MSQPWDYIAKLVCIGDSATGKSSLTVRLCEGRFSAQHDVTIGVEFGSRVVNVGPSNSSPTSPEGSDPKGKKMKLSLWDTAGQETYKSVTRSYFRGASGALLVFDVTRRPTFLHAIDWLSDLRQIADDGIVIVLVGNKSDLATSQALGGENKRAVTFQEAEDWCRTNNVLKYVETSAKSGEGVEAAFLDVAQRIYEGIEQGKYDLEDRRSGVRGPGGLPGAREKRMCLAL
ncbi:uncharacterized protein KY384_000211 [Bacidia gigantensis]|uniref:uncharacterized protein n=1 Tax=Bacidia gigantensis TaxID=2732470 RepID=UPI001D059060|nr:uncharacterized protein KY384_000211 [Bacidia gigantensis]KAG8526218.1 hypothetical protein KY384_000211 [Bacidia gigantensis]